MYSSSNLRSDSNARTQDRQLPSYLHVEIRELYNILFQVFNKGAVIANEHNLQKHILRDEVMSEREKEREIC